MRRLLSTFAAGLALVPSTTLAKTIDIKVGLSHDFQPDHVDADVGDIIRFTFWPSNHSVVRAEYLQPCIPYDYVWAGEPTFFSGPKESETSDPRPTWELEVNSTEPIFFYCSAPGSCIDWKMVGVINPNETQTIEAQRREVDNVQFQLSPGESWPDEAPEPTAPSNPDPVDDGAAGSEDGGGGDGGGGGGGGGLSPGAIAGIAIGSAAVVIIAVALIYVCGRKGGIEKGYRRSRVAQPGAQPPVVEVNYAENGAGGYYDPTKSPPPPTSPYPVPSHASTYRSSSPANWTSPMGSPQMGPVNMGNSPHASWMGHSPHHSYGASQELSATPYDPSFPSNAIPETVPPAELPATSAPNEK